jgi:DNA-directed RNA polymerase specialized sigma24 family protein
MNYKNSYEGIDPELVKMVKKAAKRAIGKAGLRKHDLPDIEQELMIATLEALKCLRENIADEKAFAARIVNNQLGLIFRSRHRESRKWHKGCLSLNIPVELDNSDVDELVNLIDSDYMLRNNSYFFPDPYLNIDLLGNINAAILKLPKDLQKLCEELKKKPAMEVMREKNMTRKNACRKIRQLKTELKKQEIFILLST